MPVPDERNILHIGPPQREGHTEITQAMADTVRRRIEDAGGRLVVWAVLHEDVYETRLCRWSGRIVVKPPTGTGWGKDGPLASNFCREKSLARGCREESLPCQHPQWRHEHKY
jgi:hypothetical protein